MKRERGGGRLSDAKHPSPAAYTQTPFPHRRRPRRTVRVRTRDTVAMTTPNGRRRRATETRDSRRRSVFSSTRTRSVADVEGSTRCGRVCVHVYPTVFGGQRENDFVPPKSHCRFRRARIVPVALSALETPPVYYAYYENVVFALTPV